MKKNMFAKGFLIFCLILNAFENSQATKRQVQLIATPSLSANNRPHSNDSISSFVDGYYSDFLQKSFLKCSSPQIELKDLLKMTKKRKILDPDPDRRKQKNLAKRKSRWTVIRRRD